MESAVVEMTDFTHTHTHTHTWVYHSFCLSVFSLFGWLRLPFVYTLFKCVSMVTRTCTHSGWRWQMLSFISNTEVCQFFTSSTGGLNTRAASCTINEQQRPSAHPDSAPLDESHSSLNFSKARLSNIRFRASHMWSTNVCLTQDVCWHWR